MMSISPSPFQSTARGSYMQRSTVIGVPSVKSAFRPFANFGALPFPAVFSKYQKLSTNSPQMKSVSPSPSQSWNITLETPHGPSRNSFVDPSARIFTGRSNFTLSPVPLTVWK